MKLHWSPRSPYVRKVMVAAHELGLADRIACVRSVAALPTPNPIIMADNPLSKIPTLVLDNGDVLQDSRTIVEYLDSLAGPGVLLPLEGPGRWRALSRQALADGLLDLLILWRNELAKPEERQTEAWIKAFATKVNATFDRFEQQAVDAPTPSFGIGEIALGCALSYADFRFAELNWRTGRPHLAKWHESFAARPSAQATEAFDG
ncbi:glutathione S-transferase family protein [Bradyrhizobium sp. GCM10027634]|uniref:glutathione S-transferase family protein n=1 Tax=unclassified Bradyrhizobium TaxID=2631580 RepID=UPI00188AB538|nr:MULTISPECIES: glutathione S-transferase family protein [unclassified Bradyrhizobium]MDN5005610.1 glutathione S-transferase family protein [Bradyrhizobium sp. WYCCWR 12677]